MAKIELNGLTGQILLNEEPAIDLNTFEQDKSLFYKGTIAYGTDLNDLTGTGIYHQTTNESAATGFNYPVAVAGVLQTVSNGSLVFQTYTTKESASYSRTFNSSWSSWFASANSNTLKTIDGQSLIGSGDLKAGASSAKLYYMMGA